MCHSLARFYSYLDGPQTRSLSRRGKPGNIGGASDSDSPNVIVLFAERACNLDMRATLGFPYHLRNQDKTDIPTESYVKGRISKYEKNKTYIV